MRKRAKAEWEWRNTALVAAAAVAWAVAGYRFREMRERMKAGRSDA